MDLNQETDLDHVVVVGVDGTSTALHAVAWAAAEADAHGGSLTIVHAAPYAVDEPGWRRADGILGRARSIARHERPALSVRTHRSEEHPVRALVDEAGSAGLLVTGLVFETVTDTVLGSVSLDVLDRTPCPVAVVRRSDVTGRGIVAGTSDGHTDAGALAVAFAEAAAHGEDLTVVHADSRGHSLPPTALLEAVGRLSTRLPQVRVHIDNVRGGAAGVLAQRSAGARMLVVGSRGPHHANRVLLGSTSRALVWNSACPVVIAPGGRDHAATARAEQAHDAAT